MNVVKAGMIALKFIKRNSPIIISAAAGLGMVLTYILTIKETEEAQEAIEEIEENEEEPQKLKIAKKVAKIYAPSFICLVISLLCIVQSTVISQHRIRDLTASCAAMAAFINDYRRNEIEIYGQDHDGVIMHSIAEEKFENDPPLKYEEGILCLLPPYPHWFWVKSVTKLKAGCLDANQEIDETGCISMGKWMKFVGAREYDEHGNTIGMDQAYLDYGWYEHELCDEDAHSGLYPDINCEDEESGLRYYVINLPMPKPML